MSCQKFTPKKYVLLVSNAVQKELGKEINLTTDQLRQIMEDYLQGRIIKKVEQSLCRLSTDKILAVIEFLKGNPGLSIPDNLDASELKEIDMLLDEKVTKPWKPREITAIEAKGRNTHLLPP